MSIASLVEIASFVRSAEATLAHANRHDLAAMVSSIETAIRPLQEALDRLETLLNHERAELLKKHSID